MLRPNCSVRLCESWSLSARCLTSQQTVLKHIETMFLCVLCFVTDKTLCKTGKSVPRSWKYFDPLLLFALFRTAFIATWYCRYLNERKYEIPIKSVEQILNLRTKLQLSLKLELRWKHGANFADCCRYLIVWNIPWNTSMLHTDRLQWFHALLCCRCIHRIMWQK